MPSHPLYNSCLRWPALVTCIVLLVSSSYKGCKKFKRRSTRLIVHFRSTLYEVKFASLYKLSLENERKETPIAFKMLKKVMNFETKHTSLNKE